MRRTAIAAALIPCALVLTACGAKSATTATVSTTGAATTASGPSNAGLTQAQLLARFKTALATVTAIHFKGTMVDSGTSVTMDLQINKDGSADGTIVSNGTTVPMVVTGGVTYIQVTSSFETEIKSEAGADASLVSSLVVGKWISSKTTVGSSLAGSFSSLTDFSTMTSQLASGSGDKFSYLGTSTLNGQAVAQYKDDASSNGGPSDGVLDVPLHGLALPIQDSAGSQGSMTFVWNQPTTVTAPAAADILTLPSA